ncbi:GTPase RsgA, partial [Salmonella enterica]|uniref:GTPase RsgA n=1 Tax=Salmonella enterica TaxID=28901 RepID=UPI003296A6F6
GGIAPEPTPAPSVADRSLAAAADAGIRAAVVVYTCDLPEARDESFIRLQEEYRNAGYPVVTLSAVDRETVAPLAALLEKEHSML